MTEREAQRRWPCCRCCTDGHMEDHPDPCDKCSAKYDGWEPWEDATWD